MASQGEIHVLLGAEASPGSTASTFVLWRGTAELHEMRDRTFAEETVGYISKNTRFADTMLHSEGTLATDQATYEQIIYPLAMSVQNVTPTGGPTYTWTFDPTLTDTIDPATMTVRYGIDGKYYQSDYVIATNLSLSANAGEAWQVSTDIAGGEVIGSGYVSTETLSAQNAILAGNTSLYIDTTWAGLGGTEITGSLINWTWELPGWHQKQFQEGTIEPTGHGLDKRAATLTMTVEWDTAQDATERTAYRAGTKRFIRLGATDSTRSANIDGCYVYTDMNTIDNRDGNITVEYTLESFFDTTSSEEYKVTVVNGIAAL